MTKLLFLNFAKLTGYQPSEIRNNGGVLSGFAVINGQVEIKSSSCNSGYGGNYGNDDRVMNEVEKSLIKRAVEGPIENQSRISSITTYKLLN